MDAAQRLYRRSGPARCTGARQPTERRRGQPPTNRRSYRVPIDVCDVHAFLRHVAHCFSLSTHTTYIPLAATALLWLATVVSGWLDGNRLTTAGLNDIV